MTTITIRPAPAELAELVCAMRPDWDRAEVDGVIYAAGLALNDWEQSRAWVRVLTEFVRIAADSDGRPRDLTEAVRSPLERRGAGVDPAPFAEHAREGMAERLAATRATDGDQ